MTIALYNENEENLWKKAFTDALICKRNWCFKERGGKKWKRLKVEKSLRDKLDFWDDNKMEWYCHMLKYSPNCKTIFGQYYL